MCLREVSSIEGCRHYYYPFLPKPGECPVVLEVTQEEDEDVDREASAAVLPVKGVSMDSAHTAESFSAGPVCFS